MLVILLSNMMIFAEDTLHLPDDRDLIQRAASSNFVSQQLPVLFGYASFSYGSVFGVLYFMYERVSEGVYARMMSFNLGVSAAKIKRSGGVLSLVNLVPSDNNSSFMERPVSDIGRSSPFVYVAQTPPASPQRPAVRKGAQVTLT